MTVSEPIPMLTALWMTGSLVAVRSSAASPIPSRYSLWRAEAVQQAKNLRPDVVLMDLTMPVMDGIAATAELRGVLPETELIALTSALDDESVVAAVQAGAIGYLLKDTEAAELRHAIKAASAGQVQLAPEAAAHLVREVRAPGTSEGLTEREVDVLRLIAAGFAHKAIARRLNIGEKTVKTHVSRILMKLGVTSRTQAALHAVREGLVPVGGSDAATDEQGV